jgi:hypothetical protein
LGKNYKDAVWCDVIPMKAYHLLLGRLWLFDKKVQYDGCRKTYSFNFEGRRLTLQSMKLQDFDPPRDDSRILTMRRFVETCHEQEVVLAVIARPMVVDSAMTPPVEIQAALDEFCDATLISSSHEVHPSYD